MPAPQSEPAAAYPLHWPAGWRRTVAHKRTEANFRHNDQRLNIAAGASRVYTQLKHFGIDERTVIISSDLKPRLDGRLPGDQPGIDPGVAVYWTDAGKQRCMASDRYVRVADNLGAVAATIEAMRAIERHGGAVILDRAFAGFEALPAPFSWWQVLKLTGPDATAGDIERAYRRLANQHHPDRGGDSATMADINRARDMGLEAIR